MISSLINIRYLTSAYPYSLSLLDRYKAVFRSLMFPVNCGLNLVRVFVIGAIIICTVYATVNEVNNCLSNTVSTVKFGAKFAASLNFSLVFKMGCLCVCVFMRFLLNSFCTAFITGHYAATPVYHHHHHHLLHAGYLYLYS